MAYYFPFGQELHPAVQADRSPKKVFVLGVYASAVHARWKDSKGKPVSPALAVASEPRIFWDGNEDEARAIIEKIQIPKEAGTLEPADKRFNGPSAKVLDNDILALLGFTRDDAWLCDLLPEARLNPNQEDAIKRKYDPIKEKYGLNDVTIPKRPKPVQCSQERCDEIINEIMQSEAELLVLLGEEPFEQFLIKAADVPYAKFKDYINAVGYGTRADVVINGRTLQLLPLTHPRNIGGFPGHRPEWKQRHDEWRNSLK